MVQKGSRIIFIFRMNGPWYLLRFLTLGRIQKVTHPSSLAAVVSLFLTNHHFIIYIYIYISYFLLIATDKTDALQLLRVLNWTNVSASFLLKLLFQNNHFPILDIQYSLFSFLSSFAHSVQERPSIPSLFLQLLPLHLWHGSMVSFLANICMKSSTLSCFSEQISSELLIWLKRHPLCNALTKTIHIVLGLWDLFKGRIRKRVLVNNEYKMSYDVLDKVD